FIFAYYVSLGIFGLLWFQWRKRFSYFLSTKKKMKSIQVEELWKERSQILEQIDALISVNIS
ncbi:MAG: hypothetical protein ACO29Q_05980, partial [Crocinitomicaceae bacterium]